MITKNSVLHPLPNARAFMDDIYSHVPSGYFHDLDDRVEIAKDTGGSPVYGEMVWEALEQVLNLVNATSSDIFLDLGSGTGKLVMQFSLTRCGVGYGMEYSKKRHESAVKARDMLEENYPKRAELVRYIRGDIFKDPLPDASIVLVDGLMHTPEKLRELSIQILQYCANDIVMVWSVGKYLFFPPETVVNFMEIEVAASWKDGQVSYIYWVSNKNWADRNSKAFDEAIFSDPESIKMTFDKFDGDGNGVLDLEEFKALLNVKITSDGQQRLISSDSVKVGDVVRLNGNGREGYVAAINDNSCDILLDGNEIDDTVNVSMEDFSIIAVAPPYLQVSGRKGTNARMNGVYKLGKKLHDGRAYFQKPEKFKQFSIRWYPSNSEWLFDQNGLRSDDSANAAVRESVRYPHLATKGWEVFEKSTWNTDPHLRIEIVSENVADLIRLD